MREKARRVCEEQSHVRAPGQPKRRVRGRLRAKIVLVVVESWSVQSCPLQNRALALLASSLAAAREKGSASGVLEHLADTLVGLGRALKVLVGTDLLANVLTLLRRDGLLARLAQLLDGLGVVAEILLAANQDDGQTLAEMQNLGDPLL